MLRDVLLDRAKRIQLDEFTEESARVRKELFDCANAGRTECEIKVENVAASHKVMEYLREQQIDVKIVLRTEGGNPHDSYDVRYYSCKFNKE